MIKNKNPNLKGRVPVPAYDRFIKKIIKSDSCWNWMCSKDHNGYGKFWDGKIRTSAHRFSWEYHFGKIPHNIHVLHSCDNRKCVNPSHLFLGTNLDNIKDKVKKKRQAIGENNGYSRLKNNDIIEIFNLRYSGETLREIAIKFGVHNTTILKIVNGETWGHVKRNK